MANDQEPTTVTISRHQSHESKQGFCVECPCEGQRLCAGGGAGEGAGGASEWRQWGGCAAECCGTALLVLLTCLPSCQDATPLQKAFSGGLVVALLVQCFDHISGAMMNPTVTLAAVVSGRLSAARGLAWAASQALGGVLGGAALRALSAPSVRCCRTAPAPHLSAPRACAVEALLGALLALANCASWDARNRRLVDSWPLRIGLTVAALTLVTGELTGASMNPVRSFVPALFSGDWSAHWVYWAGPLSGSLAGSLLHRALWQAPPEAAPRGL